MRLHRTCCLLLLTILLSACRPNVLGQANGMEMEHHEMEMESDGDENKGMDMSGGSMAADSIKTQTSESGLFTVSAISRLDPVVINVTHAWTIHIETPEGIPISDAEILVDGGMPDHAHSFPTAPQVTENLGEGDYLLEGVRFNMAGVWEMTLEITSGGKSDTVSFEFELK